jgi:hypothetical protein
MTAIKLPEISPTLTRLGIVVLVQPYSAFTPSRRVAPRKQI